MFKIHIEVGLILNSLRTIGRVLGKLQMEDMGQFMFNDNKVACCLHSHREDKVVTLARSDEQIWTT